jgi:site-specific recombinase XerD
MIQDMQLRGFSPRTQESYARAVRKLAEHYHKPPDRVTEQELRQYFLFRTNVTGWSRVACTIALCGIKFFYEQTLKRDWTTVGLLKPKRLKSLPTVLSFEEVRRTLARVHMLRHRVCLTTIYSCGLRLTEGRTLQIPNIDSDRMFLHIRGKGKQGPLRTAAQTDSGTSERHLENPSQSAVALPCPRSRWTKGANCQ